MGTNGRPSTGGTLDFSRYIPKTLSKSAIFRQEGFFLWDPSVVRDDGGTCHLFYSRWPKSHGFESWCTHAEIAWATAPRPEGPYEFQGTVLPARGGDFWDGHSVFNTCVIRADSKYIMYYTGNHGSTRWDPGRPIEAFSGEWWEHRNHQRIGVAVADHPRGPWTRMDKPLLDVGGGFGEGIVAVPNMLVRPDGRFALYYKTLAPGAGKFGGGVFHYAAVAGDPLGPFVRHPEPMVDKRKILKTDLHFNFHVDDHFEWWQEGRYYAIVKDHDAPFMTPHGRSLVLFESPDGFEWKPSRFPLVKDFTLAWEEGSSRDFDRLEMPKLLLEQGRPTLLILAAKPAGPEDSFLVLMKLNGTAESPV